MRLIDADAFGNSLRYHQAIQENNKMREVIGCIIEMLDNRPTLEVEEQIIIMLEECRGESIRELHKPENRGLVASRKLGEIEAYNKSIAIVRTINFEKEE